MNTTEERLRDALQTVGDTIGPESVPEPRLTGRRRRLPRPAAPMAVVAASAVVVAGGAAVGGAFSSGGAPGPLAPPSPGASAPTVSVHLCTKSSAKPSCADGSATGWQKLEIKRRLEALPAVRQVEFEDATQAYERFRRRFEDSAQFRQSVEVGDIPEAFRVGLAPGAGAEPVKKAMSGLPGVDTVVVEGR